MKIFVKINFLMAASHFYFIQSYQFDLQKFINVKNFYQITSFFTHDFIETLDFKMFLLNNVPSIICAFDNNSQRQYYSESSLKEIFALQESLVIFYTNNLQETRSFIDFLLPQLSIRKRPKCLIMYFNSTEKFTNDEEFVMIDSLKYGWEKKFLDVAVMAINLEGVTVNSYFSVYYFNPFINVVHKKLTQDGPIEIFPKKLQNAYGYEIYRSDFSNIETDVTIKQVRSSNKRDKNYFKNFHYIDFAARIINLTVIGKKVKFSSPSPPDFLEEENLDVFDIPLVTNVHYLRYFIIPTDKVYVDLYALVPIISVPQTGFFLKTFCNIMFVSITFSIFLYLFNHFNISLRCIGVFDFVKIFYGQSISQEPTKTINRIIYLTIVVATVKITNDFLLDAFMIQFDGDEVPFETYRDLYHSQLQPYTNIPYLKTHARYITDDPYLTKVLKKISIVDTDDILTCINSLYEWKNASCLVLLLNPEFTVSYYRDLDGTPTMKIAEPPVYVQPSGYYWFSEASPFAMKFLEVMRRVRETDLMHWPALIDENLCVLNIEANKIPLDNGIGAQQLLVILNFCLMFAAVTFITEIIVFGLRKFKI